MGGEAALGYNKFKMSLTHTGSSLATRLPILRVRQLKSNPKNKFFTVLLDSAQGTTIS